MSNDYSDLAESAQADDRRETKETSFGWAKGDDRMKVQTAEPALMRRVLSHDDFELDRYATSRSGDKVGERVVEADEYEEQGHDQRKPVWWVQGTMSIGAIYISADPRKSTQHARIISDEVL